MPGKTPERPEGGWKIHERQLQELHDWVKRERLLPGPGIIETPEGKRFQPKDYERFPQFHPTLYYGPSRSSGGKPQGFASHGNSAETKLAINTGYVYANHNGGEDPDVRQSHHTINQWAYEVPGTVLPLQNESANYIYLQVAWGSAAFEAGTSTYDGNSFAFKAHHRLHAGGQTGPASGGSGEGKFDEHSHPMSSSNSSGSEGNFVQDGHGKSIPGMPEEDGILVPIKIVRYVYASSGFMVTQDEAPPQEDEGRTYIPAGYVYLNGAGQIEGYTVSNTDYHNGFRWFLEGPVWLHREPSLTSGITTTDDIGIPDIVGAVDVLRPGVKPKVGQ